MPSIDSKTAALPPTSGRQVVLARHGGIEVLEFADVAIGPPAPGEIRLRQSAIGVNFHDIYVRKGTSGTLDLPGVPGLEAVGVVEAVGDGVTAFSVGQRAGYVTAAYGAYAEARNIDASFAVVLPDILDDASAASSLMKALTVRMLVSEACQLRSGQVILVHSAAGGTGQLLCQWAKAIGAQVIATVGHAARVPAARRVGADHVIDRTREDIVATVEALTAGAGVAVAYDAIGADTFDASLACLGFGGALVSYGQASGPPGTVAVSRLAARSLTLTRPIVFHFLRTAQQRRAALFAALGAFESGILRPLAPLRFPFDAVRDAHAALEAGSSPGGVILET